MVESLIFKDNLAAKSEYGVLAGIMCLNCTLMRSTELIDPAELAAENPPGTAGDGSMGAPTPGRSDAEGEGEGGSSQDDDDLLADLEKGLQDDDTETSRDEAEDRDEGSDSDMDGLFGGAGGSEDELVPGPEVRVILFFLISAKVTEMSRICIGR